MLWRRLYSDGGAEAIAKHYDKHCAYCGKLFVPTVVEGVPWDATRLQVIWPSACGCGPELAALEEAAEQTNAQRRHADEEAYRERLNRAGLCGVLAGQTFEAFQDRADWPDAAELRRKVETYARTLAGGIDVSVNWLVLYGYHGTGKTHLAAAAVHHLLDHGKECYLRNWPEWLARIQATFNRDPLDREWDQETTADVEDELMRGWFVAIDDLDKRQSDFTRETLYRVLNGRLVSGLPTMLTFNTHPEDADPHAPGRPLWMTLFGRANVDRIVGASTSLVFAGASFRSDLVLPAESHKEK